MTPETLRTVKRVLEWIAYVLMPIGLVAMSAVWPERDLYVTYGSLAELGLIFVLFIKPIADITGHRMIRQIVALRRPLGVSVFWLALFHGAMLMYEYELGPEDFIGLDNALFYGVWAMLGMVILGITSNNYTLRSLGRNWKRIQYTAYPVLFLTLLHSSIAEGGLGKFFILSSLYIVLKAWAHRAVHRR